MIKRNDLKDILHRASLDASKANADDAWGDMLASLDEHMPVKKKKRRFFLVFFLAAGLTALMAGLLLSPSGKPQANTDTASAAPQEATVFNDLTTSTSSGATDEKSKSGSTPASTNEGNAGIASVEMASGRSLAPKTIVKNNHETTRTSGQSKTGTNPLYPVSPKNNPLQPTPVPSSPEGRFSSDIVVSDQLRLLPYLNLKGFATHPVSLQAIKRIDTSLNIHIAKADKKDSVKPHQDDDKDKNEIQKHHLAIGGTIGYSFNNFTRRENRSSVPVFNTMYQAYKQIGLSLYARIPLTRLYQLQPEIGFEPYSTDIQINYKTTGQSVFSRYNLKRMVYGQVGFSNYVELIKNFYISAGAYYAYAMPIYGAQLDVIMQGPNNMEQVLNSKYERTDFRKNVFGLRRNDIGISGGLEYHIRHISTSIRVSRGFMDVTPETPSVYHNFNISCRLGYHFEFGKR